MQSSDDIIPARTEPDIHGWRSYHHPICIYKHHQSESQDYPKHQAHLHLASTNNKKEKQFAFNFVLLIPLFTGRCVWGSFSFLQAKCSHLPDSFHLCCLFNISLRCSASKSFQASLSFTFLRFFTIKNKQESCKCRGEWLCCVVLFVVVGVRCTSSILAS